MTQFCLVRAPGDVTSPWCTFEPLLPAQHHLTAAAELLFGKGHDMCILIPRHEDLDIDSIVLLAHSEMGGGSAFEATRLFLLLSSLMRPGVAIALWYGSDCTDLGPTDDPERFLDCVRRGLDHPSVECYAQWTG